MISQVQQWLYLESIISYYIGPSMEHVATKNPTHSNFSFLASMPGALHDGKVGPEEIYQRCSPTVAIVSGMDEIGS